MRERLDFGVSQRLGGVVMTEVSARERGRRFDCCYRRGWNNQSDDYEVEARARPVQVCVGWRIAKGKEEAVGQSSSTHGRPMSRMR